MGTVGAINRGTQKSMQARVTSPLVSAKIVDQLVFEFGHIPPKKNSRRFRKSKRGGYTVPSEAYETWHEDSCARYAHVVRPMLPPYFINARYWAEDLSIFDLSNCQESIHDWLTDVGVITDDNAFALPSYYPELCGLMDHPFVEVIVSSLERSPSYQAMHLLRDRPALKAHVDALKAQGQKTSMAAEKVRLKAALISFDEFNENGKEKNLWQEICPSPPQSAKSAGTHGQTAR